MVVLPASIAAFKTTGGQWSTTIITGFVTAEKIC